MYWIWKQRVCTASSEHFAKKYSAKRRNITIQVVWIYGGHVFWTLFGLKYNVFGKALDGGWFGRCAVIAHALLAEIKLNPPVHDTTKQG
jgi:hypothetical protein